MASCLLCQSKTIRPVLSCDHYWHCGHCDVRYLDPQYRLNSQAEKLRYQSHNNDINDPRYKNFVSPLFNEIQKRIHKPSVGLDYGAGQGPVLSVMLRESGHNIELYDPLFFENKNVFEKQYDFIFASESAEHFFDPLVEFSKMTKALVPKGFLAIMTSLYVDSIDFSSWYYRKDPTHVVFYSPKTFVWIKDTLKFKNLEIIHPRIAILARF